MTPHLRPLGNQGTAYFVEHNRVTVAIVRRRSTDGLWYSDMVGTPPGQPTARKAAERAVLAIRNRLWADAAYDHLGVLRWKSNGRVPPAEILATLPADEFAAMKAVGDREAAEAIRQYRAAQEARSDEQKAADRAAAVAALGDDVRIVNVLTGEVIAEPKGATR